MACKRDKRLVREGEPSQKTEKGLIISVPIQNDFFGALDEATK